LKILKFYEIFKELFPFCSLQWVVYRETIGLLPGKQLVVSRLGKNDKTTIAYHFGQYYCILQKE
jgi:hypothetical protein